MQGHVDKVQDELDSVGLMALALAAAFAYTNIDHEFAQRYAAGIFGV